MHLLVWLLPIFSGFLDAASRATIKATKVHDFTLVVGGFAVALPVYLVWLWIEGVPEVKPGFWGTVACHAPLLTVSILMMVKAHRVSPLTLTMPYLSLTPAFLLFTAPLMGGGSPTLIGALGVLILTFGLYVLNAKSGGVGMLAPFRAIARERGSWMMLIVASIFAFTANLDYIGMSKANAPFFLIADHGAVAIFVTIAAITQVARGKESRASLSPRKYLQPIGFYGVVLAGSIVLHMVSFRLIPVVPYVVAAKRAGAILSAVGVALFLGFVRKHEAFAAEREQAGYRIGGVSLMVLGMVIVILWGSK